LISNKPSFFTLALLASLAAVGAVIFAPALPSIAKGFTVSPDYAKWTMIIYMFGYALGQLPYGPLSSSLGRKKALYFGLFLQIFGALICGISLSVGEFILLLIGRLFLAVGGASGLVLAFAIIGDCYEGNQARKRISYLTLIFAIAPGVSIALGGLITKHLSWPYCFYFLAMYGLGLLILTFFLPETLKKEEQHPLKFGLIMGHYSTKIKHGKLVFSACAMGVVTSFNYVFATEAPFLAIDVLHISPSIYGLLNLIPPIGLLTGCVVSAQVPHLVTPLRMILFGVIGLFIGSLLSFFLFMSGLFNVWSLFLPTLIIFAAIGAVNSNAPAFAFAKGLNRAYASATLQSINLTLVAVAILCSGYLPSSILSLPFAFLGLSLIAAIVFVALSFAVQKSSDHAQ